MCIDAKQLQTVLFASLIETKKKNERYRTKEERKKDVTNLSIINPKGMSECYVRKVESNHWAAKPLQV